MQVFGRIRLRGAGSRNTSSDNQDLLDRLRGAFQVPTCVQRWTSCLAATRLHRSVPSTRNARVDERTNTRFLKSAVNRRRRFVFRRSSQ